MGRSVKFDYQTIIENSLLAHPHGLSLDELVERSGLGVDRSTLFRHLTHLIELGRVERIGKARASRYRPRDLERAATVPAPPGFQRPAAPLAPERPLPDQRLFMSPSEVRHLRQTGRAEPDSGTAMAPEHEAVIKKAVRTVVRDWKRCNRVNLQIYLSLMVKPEHLDRLTAAVEKELAGLREANLADFGLSQAEFSRFIPAQGDDAASE